MDTRNIFDFIEFAFLLLDLWLVYQVGGEPQPVVFTLCCQAVNSCPTGQDTFAKHRLSYNWRIVPEDITSLLIEWRQGNQAAFDALMPLVYERLRRIAARQMERERGDHTLQATALVHEAWMELAGSQKIEWQNRAHFLAIASRVMRQILVHHARGHNAEKRGSGVTRLELLDAFDTPAAAAMPADCDLLALDQALEKLATQDERKSRIIEMKYFGGLTNEEISDVLGVALITVRRDIQVAHAFLNWQLSGLTKA